MQALDHEVLAARDLLPGADEDLLNDGLLSVELADDQHFLAVVRVFDISHEITPST
ncbi:hypothetical protein D3C81_1792000 [compost metagenome]